MSMNINPFILSPAIPDGLFCDRRSESAALVKSILNQENVVLISPRRVGKTGLIYHCFHQPEICDSYITVSIDILHTTSVQEFIKELGTAVFNSIAKRSEKLTKLFVTTLHSLSGSFGFDPVTYTPTFDLKLGQINMPEYTLDEIFTYLDEADKPCIIAIDEFQQIGEYAEKNVEALLRTKIQRCNKAQFIFSGSKRHVMSNMFNSPSKPFYQSTISMSLDPIPVETYADFAIGLFQENGRQLTRETVETVWNRYDGFTWFVQMTMNELFAMTEPGGLCDQQMVAEAYRHVVMTQENSYKDILSHIAPKQKMVLQAIAKAGKAANITSAKFIKEHRLGSASTIQSAVKLLLKNDLITQENGVYRVYDYFFAEWLANVY